jgi:hypothetical protein
MILGVVVEIGTYKKFLAYVSNATVMMEVGIV